MQLGSSRWKELIVDGAAQWGICVTPPQVEQFARHASALLQWNQKSNLTAIVEPEQVAIKHFLDAIAPLNYIPDDGHLLDIGTGGGFPGIPLKIMRPDQPMTLIDGSRKKITFIKYLIRQLGLNQVEALQVRAEALGMQPDYHGRFRVAVCRAVADSRSVVRMTSGLIAPVGRIIVYQGPREDFTEKLIAEFSQASGFRLEVIDYRLPMLGDRRKMVLLSMPQ